MIERRSEGTHRRVICNSNKAIRCRVTGSSSPFFALRRMDSAKNDTLDELTGSGREETAPSIADCSTASLSGEKEALAKFLIVRRRH
jgi:hypothetical protein